MADLLTHVLVPFILLTPLGWRFDWLESRWTAVAMGGAAIPDLVKLSVLLDARTIEALLGVPFSYRAVSSAGGLLLIAAAIALLFAEARRRVFGFLVVGGSSALVLDGLRAFADGYANPWLYPFSYARIPTPSLYVTSDVGVTLLAVGLGLAVFILDLHRPWEPTA